MWFVQKIRFLTAFFVLSVLLNQQLYAEELKVAVASNFSAVMSDLVAYFSQEESGEIILITGSSGKLYAQIKQGAPFDILMSADQDKPAKLIDDGLALAESQITYATGSLVLWSLNKDLIKENGDFLLNGTYNKLSLANSKLAPFGLAAKQVLTKLGLDAKTRAKWVQGENISQTFQFVASGNADIGFVAKSQIWANNQLTHGSAWFVPSDYHEPIKQDAVIIKNTKNIVLAKKVISFLQSASVQQKIESYGYQPTSN